MQALDYASAGKTSILLVIFSLAVLCVPRFFRAEGMAGMTAELAAKFEKGMAGVTTELAAKFEKRFSPQTAIRCDMTQQAGRFFVTVLFGQSGSGKTTILRCLAGLERPESGSIRFGEGNVVRRRAAAFPLAPERTSAIYSRNIPLFPHLTVAENVAFGIRSLSGKQRRDRTGEMLERFELTGLENSYPHRTSGGQRQRIALARVMARRPRLLLLDEPLSALDAMLREGLRGELRRMLSEFDIPAVMVTQIGWRPSRWRTR